MQLSLLLKTITESSLYYNLCRPIEAHFSVLAGNKQVYNYFFFVIVTLCIIQISCCMSSSATKFDSGSGWPSFSDVLVDKDVDGMPAVDTIQDRSVGMVRTEVRCGKVRCMVSNLG